MEFKTQREKDKYFREKYLNDLKLKEEISDKISSAYHDIDFGEIPAVQDNRSIAEREKDSLFQSKTAQKNAMQLMANDGTETNKLLELITEANYVLFNRNYLDIYSKLKNKVGKVRAQEAFNFIDKYLKREKVTSGVEIPTDQVLSDLIAKIDAKFPGAIAAPSAAPGAPPVPPGAAPPVPPATRGIVNDIILRIQAYQQTIQDLLLVDQPLGVAPRDEDDESMVSFETAYNGPGFMEPPDMSYTPGHFVPVPGPPPPAPPTPAPPAPPIAPNPPNASGDLPSLPASINLPSAADVDDMVRLLEDPEMSNEDILNSLVARAQDINQDNLEAFMDTIEGNEYDNAVEEWLFDDGDAIEDANVEGDEFDDTLVDDDGDGDGGQSETSTFGSQAEVIDSFINNPTKLRDVWKAYEELFTESLDDRPKFIRNINTLRRALNQQPFANATDEIMLQWLDNNHDYILKFLSRLDKAENKGIKTDNKMELEDAEMRKYIRNIEQAYGTSLDDMNPDDTMDILNAINRIRSVLRLESGTKIQEPDTKEDLDFVRGTIMGLRVGQKPNIETIKKSLNSPPFTMLEATMRTRMENKLRRDNVPVRPARAMQQSNIYQLSDYATTESQAAPPEEKISEDARYEGSGLRRSKKTRTQYFTQVY